MLGYGYVLEWDAHEVTVIRVSLTAPETPQQAQYRLKLHAALAMYGAGATGLLLSGASFVSSWVRRDVESALQAGPLAPSITRPVTLRQFTDSRISIFATEVFLMLQALKAAGAGPALPNTES